jgi:hypothetical protein
MEKTKYLFSEHPPLIKACTAPNMEWPMAMKATNVTNTTLLLQVRLKARKKKKARLLETEFCPNIPRKRMMVSPKASINITPKWKLTRAHPHVISINSLLKFWTTIRLPTAKAKRRNRHGQAEAKSK